MTDALHLSVFDTELGPCGVVSSTVGIVATTTPGVDRIPLLRDWVACRTQRTGETVVEELGRNAEAIEVITNWIAGERIDFDPLVLAIDGTPFQRAIWNALREVPYGSTVSYKELATAAGHPTAVRACGAANGANRLPLVIPCHRVVASDGSLGGFSGGVGVKPKLLALERRVARTRNLAPAPGHLF